MTSPLSEEQTATTPKRARRTKEQTATIRDTIMTVLAENAPMTVRQVYYQLVARQLIANNRSQYQGTSDLLVKMRQEGDIPWKHIEDRNRRPRTVNMWDNLPDFLGSVRWWYQKDVWATQPRQLEVWLEKDALSGIFEDVLRPNGITLNVGRGYDGWSSIRNAAVRYGDGSKTTVLYFGDFDPSGEDMVRSLIERLAFFDSRPEIVKCALTLDDVRRYNLPHDFTKATDSRQAAFVERWGDVAVELDALPVTELRNRLVREVNDRLDLDAMAACKTTEKADIATLRRWIDDLNGPNDDDLDDDLDDDDEE